MKNVRTIIKSEPSPNEHIRRKTKGEIEAYISGRGKTRVYQGARNLSLNVSDDYGNRFLIELIQNAHDAHPAERSDGEIAIVLAREEGPHGCLYVANRGNGFDKDNFDSITTIALSSKPVNESIGNKGLGFRSVLQICHWPEIYSASSLSKGNGFDGYCFRFAKIADLDAILGEMGQPTLSKEIDENMPCWFLPVVATARPGLVQRFASQGFVTVVRMTLESDEARTAVVEQIRWLVGHEHPLQLFLNRIARITIENEPDEPEVLKRQNLGEWSHAGVEIQRLAIGPHEFLVCSKDLEPESFRPALDDSIVKNQVPAAWNEWKGPARVSIAIRLNLSVEKGLLYCFLPLGVDGRSPFAGYINANFYTKIDRRSVDGSITVNRLFISSAAGLCKHAIEFLIEKNWPESSGGVVDLLCWSGSYVSDIRQAFDKNEQNIIRKELLPTSTRGEVNWKTAEETFIWNPPENSCLSVEALSDGPGPAILLTSLSNKQREAVEKFFGLVDQSFEPSAETIADWVEAVAQRMLKDKSEPERWAALYDEVAKHLRSDSSVLFGKRFLLTATGDLIASYASGEHGRRRRAADIYFPPSFAKELSDGSDADDASILPLEQLPSSIKRGFVFLSPEVPWLSKDGGYRPARAFFLEAKLVREYDTREVLRSLAITIRSPVAESTKQTALEWAFRLWSSGRSLSDKETRNLHLSVPTRSGWKSSEEAMFGSGWPTPNGKPLERFLKQAGNMPQELAEARERLLPPHQDWPIRFGSEEDWHRFLHAAGVRDCLRPIGGEKRLQKDALGHSIVSPILNSVELDADSMSLWQSQLEPLGDRIRNPNTSYRAELSAWRLPAQGQSLSFSDLSLRREYADQLMKAIPQLKKEHWSFRVFRPGRFGSDSNEEQWPTPIKAFITEASWLPVQRLGSELRFVAPRDAWMSSLDFDPRPPRFIDLVSPSVARTSEEALAWLRLNADLGVLDNPDDAARVLRVCAQAACSKLTDDTDVRRFRELFSDAWNNVIEAGTAIKVNSIPVRIGDRIEALSLTDEDQAALRVSYYVDEDNDAKKFLLEELEEAVFDFDVTETERSWQRLEKLAPGRFRRMSEQPLEVHVDGSRFEPTQIDTPLLRDVFGSWITSFFVSAAEHKGGAFFSRTQKTLSRLKQNAEVLRFVLGRKLEISMGGIPRELPASVRGGVVLRHGATTTLVVESREGTATLLLLASVAGQLAMALNQKSLANGFEAALLRLANQVDDSGIPADEDIAEALGVDIEELEQTRRYAQLDLSSHVRFALPLAAYLDLPDSIEALEKVTESDDLGEDRVVQVLCPIARTIGLTEQELIARLGMVSDMRDLKEVFDLSLPKLNTVLRALDGIFRPISNKERHLAEFRAYLANHNARIVGRIRSCFVDQFDNLQDLSSYVLLRSAAEKVEPDVDWFEIYDELPEEVMAQKVEIWLLSQEVSESTSAFDLPGLSECREKNGRALSEFAKNYGAVLSAWVRLSENEVSDSLRTLWLEPEVSKLGLIQHAQGGGWIEFRLLDDNQIVSWLERSGLWPKGKPASTSLAEWGLPEETFSKAQKDAEKEREARRKERGQITFAGQKISALTSDYQALMDAVRNHLSEAAGFLDTDAGFRSLIDMEERTGSGSGTGGGSGSGSRNSPDSTMSDEQKGAVGFVGERLAFEWIKAFHQKKHNLHLDDNCWVSGNRNIVFGGTSGRDNLGYDFVVQLSSTTYYYEVKASIGNPKFFEMGPTEIGAALRYKADRDNRYRILYVAFATDPQRAAATILQNPFSREGQKKLRAIGRGSVKYEFGLANDD